jgi:hypothetical protein
MGCSERPAPPSEVDRDAANAIDAPPGANDGADSESGSGAGESDGAIGTGGATDAGGSRDASGVDRCQADVYDAQPLPVDIYVVADSAESANCPPGERCSSDSGVPPPGETRWATVTSAIERFAAAPGGASVGLGLFPRFSAGGNAVSCLGDDYVAPDLPFGASPDVIASLVGALTPRGDWLLQAPLAGALRYARTHAEANPDRQTLVALMTHGSETNACGDDTFDGAVQMAASAWAATPAVKTTVISLLPSLADWRRVAEAGGTRGYSLNQASADARGETLAALRAAAAPCDFAFPETPTPARTQLALLVELRLGPVGEFSYLFRMEKAEHCPAEGGWFANNNLNPSRVSLCPATCRSMTMTPGSAVQLVVGCLT